jgi:hypothetical protein
MLRYDQPEPLTIRESFGQLTVEDLKPLIALVRRPMQGRKADLVAQMAQIMEDPKEVRALYEGLDAVAQKAVQEATHDPEGVLHADRFQAKYGQLLNFGGSGRYPHDARPKELRLFFPQYHMLPTDLQAMLRAFVPEPPPLTANTREDLPARVRRPHVHLGPYHAKPDPEEVELRVRATARAAQLDVRAVLRLVDAGDVRVSDKTRRPTQAALSAVAAVLTDGDFYGAEDEVEEDWDPAADLTMKPFAWPMLVQAAGLAQLAGTRLQLTPAGRKATTQPAHEVLRHIWDRWLKTTLLDEFNRVSIIKGQQGKGKGGLTAVAPRRQAIVAVLRECPPKRWLDVEELFRLLRVSRHPFAVSRDPWRLYLFEQQYGSFGYDAPYTWESLQGRYVLAFLFEYAATLGLVDVAYISPAGARNDFYDHWGSDDISCLSRYDGLLYVRLNALGAWCLGRAERYEPEAVAVQRVLRVLPNLDIVAGGEPLSPADVLLLDRFAERQGEAVWHLTADRVLTAVEEGLTVAELADFLAARSQGPLPQTVAVFLSDLEHKVGQLEDQGSARLIACADAAVAQLLAHDGRLRQLCQLAGERHLVFRAADEKAVRRELRARGYVLPPAR